MINNCNLNNLEACGLSVGGVKELYIVPFGSLYDYEYEDDNFGFISDFKSTNSFVEFKVQNAQFTQTSAVEDGRFYRNKFVFEVPKLAKEKRNEFERFIEKGVTYIFKDNNGKCWLIGREFPQKCTTLNASTGGDASLYRLEVDGLSRSQMQEVVCIDLGCFASFNGSFTTLSQFVVGNASTFDWYGLIQIVGGTNLYQYTPNQPLQPTLWSSDSSVNAQDAQEFLYLVGNNPAQTAVVLVYDSLNDNAFIQFYSNTFAYDNLTFNTQTPIDSTLSTTINLQLTLSQALSTSSTITVTDSSAAVVYSGAPDDIIGVGNSQINGMVSNAFIDAALYPNGTTFTAQVNGSDCETEFYEFVMPSVANCDLDVDSQFLWGLTYTIVIDKWDLDATYRKLKIVFGTWEFDIYPEYADYQSTFSVLEADLITAFTSNPNIPIDATTINITEQAKTFTIEFKGTESNLPFYAHIRFH